MSFSFNTVFQLVPKIISWVESGITDTQRVLMLQSLQQELQTASDFVSTELGKRLGQTDGIVDQLVTTITQEISTDLTEVFLPSSSVPIETASSGMADLSLARLNPPKKEVKPDEPISTKSLP